MSNRNGLAEKSRWAVSFDQIAFWTRKTAKWVLTLTQGQGSTICVKNTPDGESRRGNHYDLNTVRREKKESFKDVSQSESNAR